MTNRRPRVSALWQRNVIGAVLTVSALAVLTVTELWPNWSSYRQTVATAHLAAAGQSLTVDGQTWRVASVRHLNAEPGYGLRPLPVGTVLTVISIERSDPRTGGFCAGVITDGTRRWNAQGVSGFGSLPPDGANVNCSKPGPVHFAFLLPHDAVPTAVDVTTLDGRIMIRLRL